MNLNECKEKCIISHQIKLPIILKNNAKSQCHVNSHHHSLVLTQEHINIIMRRFMRENLSKDLKIHTNNYGAEWPERRQQHQARWKFNKKLPVSSEMLVIWCWPSCSIFHLQQQQGCGAAFSRRFSRFARLARPRESLWALHRVFLRVAALALGWPHNPSVRPSPLDNTQI